MEIWITLIIVVAVCWLGYWLFSKAPAPINQIGQLVVIGAGCIWLIMHIRELIHAIAGQ